MSFKQYWASQFSNPTGFGGKISTFIMNRLNKASYNAVFSQVPKNSEILDIGFGNGYLIKHLVKKTNATIYGVDISKDMVKLATKRNKKAVKNNKVMLTTGSVDNIPFDKQFDFIYSVNTVYFWKNLADGLLAIKNKLKNNGSFMNVLYTKEFLDKLSYTQYGFTKYTPNELLKAYKDVGFNAEIVEIEKDKSFYILAIK
ncbi:MAG: methyltransferase domain-containing protein [Firmicutes bacterium]|nr:methyltransferase domain-containing protein [Bacillota bacterium]